MIERAMMSDPGPSGHVFAELPAVRWWSGTLEARKVEAVREARRILDVAEPRGDYPGLVRRYPPRPYETKTFYVLNGFAAHDPDPWSIMAESLGAFLSAPDPAEYLRAIR